MWNTVADCGATQQQECTDDSMYKNIYKYVIHWNAANWPQLTSGNVEYATVTEFHIIAQTQVPFSYLNPSFHSSLPPSQS